MCIVDALRVVWCTCVYCEVPLVLHVCGYMYARVFGVYCLCALSVLHVCCKCEGRVVRVCASVWRVLCLGCEVHGCVLCMCGGSAGAVCVTCAMFTAARVCALLQWVPLQASITNSS